MTRALLLLAFVASACDRPDPGGRGPSVPPPPPKATAFLGMEWRPEAVDGVPADSLPGGDALISVSFTDRPFGDLDPEALSLGGYDGCNDFGMAYRLDGDPTSPGGAGFRAGAVSSTAMACGAPGEHVSDRTHRALAVARSVRLDAGLLVFSDSLGAERVAFVPRPVRSADSAAFVAGRWWLDTAASTVTGPDAQPLQPYTVAFRPDSTYAGEAGCARFGGTYALAGDHFWHTSSDRYDVDGCPADAPERRGMTLELATGEVEADAGRLVFHRREDGRTLVFTRPG